VAAHADLSASAADRWMACPGSFTLSQGAPRTSSKYADEGTAAHELLEVVLSGSPVEQHLGREIVVDGNNFLVTDEMVDAVQTCVNNIKEVAGGGLVLAEQRVDYNLYLQSSLSAFGTADCIVVGDNELQVHDFKYGRGVVVEAEANKQMMLYGLGALASLNDSLGPFETVRLFIHQPRVQRAPSEWSIGAKALMDWGFGQARKAATAVANAQSLCAVSMPDTWEGDFLNPGDKQCRFCPAKATCPALARDVAATVSGREAAAIDEFDALPSNLAKHVEPAASDWLANALNKADLIEGWLKAVRAEAERRMLAGTAVPGWKLVQGRMGDRAWADKAAVEEILKNRYRLKVEEMYDLKLISPTTAEKLAESKVLGPRQWKDLATQITRAVGKLSIAPESDKRPAVTSAASAEEFSTPASSDAFC
jgi:Protein of unknown function (DUF2800)